MCIRYKVNYYNTDKSRIFNNALPLQEVLWYQSLGSVSYSNAKSDETEWPRRISRVTKQTALWLWRNHNYYCNNHYWYTTYTKAFVTTDNILWIWLCLSAANSKVHFCTFILDLGVFTKCSDSQNNNQPTTVLVPIPPPTFPPAGLPTTRTREFHRTLSYPTYEITTTVYHCSCTHCTASIPICLFRWQPLLHGEFHRPKTSASTSIFP
jgi:hypothetical protein